VPALMFISKLIRTVEQYDLYGIHRINGIKVVYVLLVLFVVNGLVYIPDAYFYLFYVPMTGMTAEVQGRTLQQKYELFIRTTLGAIIMIYLFNVMYPFPLWFLFFAFLATFLMYKIVLNKHENYLIIVPIILSLTSYSLNYRIDNENTYSILNHALTSTLAMFVVLGALLLFPRSFYYRIWLRALYWLVKGCYDNFNAIQHHQPPKEWSQHLAQMVTYSCMVSRRKPTYTILKISLLVNKLYLLSVVADKPLTRLSTRRLQHYVDNLKNFQSAINDEKPCMWQDKQEGDIFKLIQSWNYLCQKS
jgi:hypothetical protein